ncbi:hypothetical protein BaRGS_00033447 [Batillaria attramentaria]|uniref:Glycosyl hydrolase family 13 catalytic domain-containing protein n=1 Tax=Batillaria attramentaria TaxID=370345 RepID=A0ABD0JKT8_9CAEN
MDSSAKTGDKSSCTWKKVCQTKVWIPTIVIALIIGIAVAVTVVLVKGGDDSEDRSPANLKWWQKTIVYQIYPRSFKDTDGDGVGDLKGIVSKLDHFTYLGVGAIWISPFYPSPMRDIGYDTTSQVDVDPLFGNLTDFDLVVKEAHERGIRVIIDFVPGYTSTDHPWFQKSVKRIKPYDEYYVWADGLKLDNGSIVRPSNWVSSFGYSAWEWNPERQQYYYHSFTVSQPQLNYRSAHVREDMKNVIRFWFERGVDGMRVDAVAYMMVSSDYYKDQPNSGADDAEPWQMHYYIPTETQNVPDVGPVVREWRELLDSFDDSDENTDHSKFMVVELYDLPEVRNRYYDYGADMPFNFDLVTAINPVYHPEHCDAICIRDEIKQEYDTLPEGKWANFVLSNHDNMRASTRIGPRYADALHVLLLTLQGTPTTYYGEELAMLDIQVSFEETVDPWGINYGPDHYREVSRDPCRSPMQWDTSHNAGFTDADKPWLPVHPNYHTVNVETEKNSTNVTTLQVYRDLASLRSQPSLQHGEIEFGHVDTNILSYLRSANGHAPFVVIINFGNVTVTGDFSRSPVDARQGQVKVVTSAAANEGRFRKGLDVSLESLTLYPGDGLVLQL